MNRKTKKIIPIFVILIFIYVLTLRARPKKSLVHMSNSIGKNKVNNVNNLPLVNDQSSKNAEFDTKTIKYIPQESILQIYKSIIIENPEIIDWNRLAYVFYATNPDNLYPVLVNIRQLVNFNSKAKFHLIYSFDIDENFKNQAENIKFHKIIKLLENRYNVKMVKYKQIKSKFNEDSTNWSDSFTKLWAFSLTQYDRVIYLDADSIINNKMDQLFFLPPSLLAVPINYINHPKFQKPKIVKPNKKLNEIELPPTPLEYSITIKDLFKKFIENEMNFDDKFYNKFYNSLPSMENSIALYSKLELCSYVMVIMPDENVFNWIMKIIDEKKPKEYDMEIINNIWKISDINNNNFIKRSAKNEKLNKNPKNPWLKSILIPSLTIIPHEPYALLSGEFKSSLLEHAAYLTNPNDFGYLTKSYPLLSIQRSIKNGNNYKNIEEAVESYPEIPYWDWAWRFDYEGNVINIKELETDIEIDKLYNQEKKINKRNNEGDDDDYEEVDFGMGIAKFGWDSKKIVEDSVYIHWSDWPLGKPWEFEQNDNNNNDDDSLWLFDKIADENLAKCKSEINDLISTLKFAQNSKEGQLLEKERKFGIRTCEESIESWKKIYRDYWNIMLEVMEEIYE